MKMKKLYLFSIFLLCISNYIFSQSGKSLTLNGIDQYAVIKHHQDFNISSNESYTICFWMKAAELKPQPLIRILSKRDVAKKSEAITGDAASGYEFWGLQNTTDKFLAINTPGPGATAHTNSMSVYSSKGGSLNSWVHVALVVDRNDGPNGKIKFYHDGVKVNDSGTKDVSKWYVNNPLDVLLGAGRNDAINYYFKGELDNVRFYKKALTDAGILSDMSNNAGLDTEGLMAAYDFESIIGNKAQDISGRGHEAILYNYPVDGPCLITNINSKHDLNYSGKGNTNEVIQKLAITAAGGDPANLISIALSMNNTTNINDVSKIKVYSTGKSNSFDSRKTDSYTLLGECMPVAGEITCPLNGNLTEGTTYLWLTYDIKETAVEGNRVDGNIISIKSANQTYPLSLSTNQSGREIILLRKLLFAPGDYNSTNYRIPTVVVAHDGSIVTATDKRKVNQTDLPEDIDILINRSTDNGKTWSEPLTIAQGTGRYKGFGDAALVRTNEAGGLLCIFVGGTGFFESTPSQPIRTYVCKSADNGITWSTPKDITSQLYGANCSDISRSKWYGSFCTSGAGLLGSDGTIYFVAAVRETSSTSVGAISNYVYYSRDNGETWNVSSCVMPSNGNEAKIAELNDKTLLVSIRNQNKGSRYYATSVDRGENWSEIKKWNEMVEPGCNGDMIYYTSVNDGYEKNRILHSVPDHASDRSNVTVFISYDEGKTWPVKKSICPGGSAYSSLCKLPDGTIGAYVEENDGTADYSMYFVNFSLEWLSNGQDIYHTPGSVEVTAAPQFSIPAGSYETPQNIELTSATKDAKIYYTLDGSIPTEQSSLYQSPVKISETTTIKAFAKKEGMVNSEISASTYIFSPSGRYCFPQVTGTGSKYANTYIERITTTGATTNITHDMTERIPFAKVPDQVVIEQGRSFNLSLKAKNMGSYSTSTVRQDLRYTVAIMYIDWNQDYIFSPEEGIRIAGKLSSEGLHNIGGNYDVLDIQKTIQIPDDAPEGLLRCRVYYTNAWETAEAVLSKVCDQVKEGVVCDFDINVKKTPTSIIANDAKSGIKTYSFKNTIIVNGARSGSVYQIYNTLGQLVLTGAIKSDSHKIIDGKLKRGLYIINITDGDKKQKSKLILN